MLARYSIKCDSGSALGASETGNSPFGLPTRVQLGRLPPDEPAVRRYVEELWFPYHRELEAAVDGHALADGVDVVEAEVAFRLDWLDADGNRLWVAFEGDDAGPEADGFADADCAPAGFAATRAADSPDVFDGPERVILSDIYVRDRYRGTGLARELVERTAADAGEAERAELALDVHAENERAVAFYESLGFETRRRRMTIPVERL